MILRLVALASLLSATAAAQVTPTVDLTARGEHSATDGGTRIGIAPALELRGSRSIVTVRGFLDATTDDGHVPFAGFAGSALLSRSERVEMQLIAAIARADAIDTDPSMAGEVEGRAHWRWRNGGAWVGGGARWDDARSAVPLVGSGIWARWRSATLTGSVRRTQYAFSEIVGGAPRFDTLQGQPLVQPSASNETRSVFARATELRLGVEIVRGPLALSLDGGARLGDAGVSTRWGALSAALSLSPHLAVVASWGDEPFTSELRRAPGRHIAMGIRMSPRALMMRPSRRASPPHVASIEVEPAGEGRHVFRAIAPGARSVELSGDFSGWEPVSLTRTSSGTWVTTLPLAAGVHHFRMRIDGGGWIVPPGMMSASDGYGGTAGVLVVPEDESKRVR